MKRKNKNSKRGRKHVLFILTKTLQQAHPEKKKTQREKHNNQGKEEDKKKKMRIFREI